MGRWIRPPPTSSRPPRPLLPLGGLRRGTQPARPLVELHKVQFWRRTMTATHVLMPCNPTVVYDTGAAGRALGPGVAVASLHVASAPCHASPVAFLSVSY